MRNFALAILLLVFPACRSKTQVIKPQDTISKQGNDWYKTIAEIPCPLGYERVMIDDDSFPCWLRRLRLKKDKRVFLFNGLLKDDQSVQFAVLNEKTGNKDLQQCADAIIRLRAEYYFSQGKYDSILFSATNGTLLSFSKWRTGTRYHLSGNKLNTIFINTFSNDINTDFENYLETVFLYACTYSLASELQYVTSINKIEAGDVFIKPGFPGHAMIVVDVCINKKGKKLFMLAQGYMPAQDMHIVVNPMDKALNPWYEVPDGYEIITPEWKFTNAQLKRWR